MKRQLLAISLAAVGSLVGLCPLRAQDGEEYMYEIGPAVGASWAYGDVNRSSALYDPSLAYGLLFRYNVNLRWAFALDFTGNRLTGDSHDFDNVMPGGTDWSFDRRYWQFGIRPEHINVRKGSGGDLDGIVRTVMMLGHYLEMTLDTDKGLGLFHCNACRQRVFKAAGSLAA